ncbi:hypothetical protein K449DRAFT_436265 [Hypoxylon sp. EC38]|nr:hypothetical protein K449DRAFT_436265 [Hypoxylon sp. EC38]
MTPLSRLGGACCGLPEASPSVPECMLVERRLYACARMTRPTLRHVKRELRFPFMDVPLFGCDAKEQRTGLHDLCVWLGVAGKCRDGRYVFSGGWRVSLMGQMG